MVLFPCFTYETTLPEGMAPGELQVSEFVKSAYRESEGHRTHHPMIVTTAGPQ